MTGFTLGASAGGTLGNESGGTLGTAPTTYLLDGQPLPGLVDEIATHRNLTLSFRVQTEVLLNRLRKTKANEGQVDVTPTDSGGFRATDRAGGENTFWIEPPNARQPLRTVGEYHVERYEENLVSSEVDEWDVELELVRGASRDDSQALSDTGDLGAMFDWTFDMVFSGGDWGVGTRFGTIITDRVDAQFLGTGADGVERFELTLRLEFVEALAFESALSKLDGVRVRSIPDGSNLAVDDTPDDANTLSVTSPTEDVIESGEYVTMGWESRRLNDAFQEIGVEIGRKA